MTGQNTYLLNQLRNNSLYTQILVNVFRRLVLSNIRYISTILITCNGNVLSKIQVMQNRLIRAIGINRDTDREKHSITNSANFIKPVCFEQMIRILEMPRHPRFSVNN